LRKKVSAHSMISFQKNLENHFQRLYMSEEMNPLDIALTRNKFA